MARGDLYYSFFPTILDDDETQTVVVDPGLTDVFPPDEFEIIGHHIIDPTGRGGSLRATIVVIAREILSVPSAVLTLIGNTGTSSGEVDLAWMVPTDDGGSAITDYFVESSPDGINFVEFVHAPSVSTNITVTGLTPATQFFFRVSAINAVGTGPPSNVADEISGA